MWEQPGSMRCLYSEDDASVFDPRKTPALSEVFSSLVRKLFSEIGETESKTTVEPSEENFLSFAEHLARFFPPCSVIKWFDSLNSSFVFRLALIKFLRTKFALNSCFAFIKCST